MKMLKKLLMAMIIFATQVTTLFANEFHMEFVRIGNHDYWYEYGKIQGKYGDPKNIIDAVYGIERGREIYDPATDAWYWLDACYGGAKATSKEVWFPYIYQDEKPGSTNGKWVRYDMLGGMVKGWCCVMDHVRDKTTYQYYFYDKITGAMYKGWHNEICSPTYAWVYGNWPGWFYFNETTGILATDAKDPVSFGNTYPQLDGMTLLVVDKIHDRDFEMIIGRWETWPMEMEEGK